MLGITRSALSGVGGKTRCDVLSVEGRMERDSLRDRLATIALYWSGRGYIVATSSYSIDANAEDVDAGSFPEKRYEKG